MFLWEKERPGECVQQPLIRPNRRQRDDQCLQLPLKYPQSSRASRRSPLTANLNSAMRFREIPPFDQNDIKNEPMLFNCSVSAAAELGGPITRSFLDALGSWGVEGIVDTRVYADAWLVSLHSGLASRRCTEVAPRWTAKLRDPRVFRPPRNGASEWRICPTQFASGQCEMPDVPLGEITYRIWHDEIERQIRAGILKRTDAPSNRVIFFDSASFHQGQKALCSGWRWFGRVSIGTDRKPTNELRKQVQVYLEFPTEGW